MLNISPYAKAVVSGVGNLVTVGTAATSILELAPPDYRPAAIALSGLVAVLGVANTFHVWLVKNEPVIVAAVDAAEELVTDVEAVGKHSAPVIVTSPAPATKVDVPDPLPGFVPGPFAQSITTAAADGAKAAADAMHSFGL